MPFGKTHTNEGSRELSIRTLFAAQPKVMVLRGRLERCDYLTRYIDWHEQVALHSRALKLSSQGWFDALAPGI
jgi:hypothetical protein